MALSVGRCLWVGVGEAERTDCGAHDERAGAANVLRRAQFADAGVPCVRSPHGQWGPYGGVSSMVPNAVSRQAVSCALGWGQLPSWGRNEEVSCAGECRLVRGRLENYLSALCP